MGVGTPPSGSPLILSFDPHHRLFSEVIVTIVKFKISTVKKACWENISNADVFLFLSFSYSILID